MSEANVVTSAIIIPFPAKEKPKQDQIDLDGHERLVLALERLNAALAEQREVVSKWRDSLLELKKSVNGMGNSTQVLHDTLGTVKDDAESASQIAQNTIKILDDSGMTTPNT